MTDSHQMSEQIELAVEEKSDPQSNSELKSLRTDESKPDVVPSRDEEDEKQNQSFQSESSLDDVSLRDRIEALVSELDKKRLTKQYKSEKAPWKCDIGGCLTCKSLRDAETCKDKYGVITNGFGSLLKYGIPWILLLLIILANTMREDRKSISSTCQVFTYVSEAVFDSSPTLTINTTSKDVYKECYELDNDGLSDQEPASQGWKIILSLIPFVCVFQGVLAYDLSSRYVAPFTLMVTIYLGMVFFEDEGWWIREDTETQSNAVEVSGLVFLTVVDRVIWTIFEYAFNVFTAFFFLRVLEYWGVVDQMRLEFEEMCPTPAKKITLILFCFAVMIAVVAPGGSNFLIAGAIMIEINKGEFEKGNIKTQKDLDNKDINVGSICLFGNGLTSAFNLVGVCIIAISSDILELAEEQDDNICSLSDYPNIEDRETCAAKQIGGYFSMMFFIFSVFSPILMAILYETEWPKSKIIPKINLSNFNKSDWIVMLICGFVYATVQLLTAWFIGPELVCLLAAGFALIAYYIFEQCSRYGSTMHGKPNLLKRKFAMPFIILIIILCIVRLVPNASDVLEGSNNEIAQTILNPSILSVEYLSYSFNRNFGWLAHSGMAVLFTSILTPFVTPYFDLEKQKEEQELKQRKKPQPLYQSVGLEEFGGIHQQHTQSKLETAKQRDNKKKTKKRILAEMNVSIGQKRIWVLREAFAKSIGEALPVMVSIGSYAGIAKIMAGFNMTQTIAFGIVDLLDAFGRSGGQVMWAFFIPIIGMLGSGLTGSTTTSNFLFGQLQVQTSIDLDLVGNDYNSVWEIAGDQIFGSTTGEIISPMNAVFSTLLLASRFNESILMNRVLLLALVWGICCSIISIIFIVPRNFIN